VISESTWATLASLAEQITAEGLTAEMEILSRPKLMEALGLPKPLLNVLRGSEFPTPAALRVVRYDFHPTSDGWRISEANADVPGGYSESSWFTKLFAEQYPSFRCAGYPAEKWTDAFLANVDSGARVALLAATGYIEDQQVVAYLAKILRDRGINAVLAHPRQVVWRNRRALFSGRDLQAIVRFYQAEWLAKLSPSIGWSNFFRGAETPVVNPGTAIVIESKRFPLVWNQLTAVLPTWRALLPETRDPREVDWKRDESWLLKTAFCNTGDTVSIRHLMSARLWGRVQFSALFFPNRWIAQRRFDPLAIETPLGLGYPCVGVYTINGRAAGAYVRIAAKPIIDFEAVDVPLLIQPND
jgi:glutathionylspermidine synthase